MATHDVQEHEDFKKMLELKGLKYTYERRTICDEVLELRKHFDADSLYERFKEKGLRISRDTVYRTIPLLLESGIIQKSVGEGKREFYELIGKEGHHDHMICISCGNIIEFHCQEIEDLQEKIVKKYQASLVFHDHRLFVHCKSCVQDLKKKLTDPSGSAD